MSSMQLVYSGRRNPLSYFTRAMPMKSLLLWCLIFLSTLSLPADAKRHYGAQPRRTAAPQNSAAFKSPKVWSGWSRTSDSSIYVRFGRTSGAHPIWHWQFRNVSDAPIRVTFTYNTVAQTKPAQSVDVPAKSISRDMFDASMDGKLKPDVKIEKAE